MEKSEVDQETAKWRCALVAYVMGDLPGYNFMNMYITKNWGNIAQPDLYLHEDGYYIIKFQSIEDMQEVLYTGPHTINNRSIILKQWSADFDFAKKFLAEIPLWVTFPNLPMNCWSCNSLSRIASAIGKPIYADECTTKQTRISYARMLIETNVTKPLPEVITVHDPNGRQFVQEVWFDRKPEFCNTCLKIGHDCDAYPQMRQDDVPQDCRATI